jgi:hypothetical protein
MGDRTSPAASDSDLGGAMVERADRPVAEAEPPAGAIAYQLATAIAGAASAVRSFRWSFRQALHGTTGPYQPDGGPDLSSEDGTERYGVDGRGSTSNL